MKTLKKVLAAILLVAGTMVSIPQVQAAPAELTQFASGGTDVGTTICYAVVSANSKNQKQPVVTYVSATSDKAASVVQFYTVATNVQANYASTTTSLPVAKTNGFVSGDVIIIRHIADDTYEKRILTTFTSATNLTVTSAPTVALVAGDMVYKASTAGAIPVGATTKELNGAGIYAGQAGLPLLIEVDGTSACQLNAVAATYPQN